MSIIESIPRTQADAIETLDILVDHVSAPAVEFDQGLQYEPIQDDEELLRKAQAVRDELDEEIAQQEEAIESQLDKGSLAYGSWNTFYLHLGQVVRGDWQQLPQMGGIALDKRWFTDIARSMLRSRPVEVEVATASRSTEVVEDKKNGTPAEYVGDLFTRQEAGVYFGAMLRRIQGFEYVRPVVAVDDIHTDTLPPQIDIISDTYQRLGRIGVLGPNDIPGRDFLLLPYSRSSARTDELIQRLDESESGLVATYSDGRVFLRPNKRVYDSMVEQYNSRDSQLHRSGVLLRDTNGMPSRAALEAASYLNPINTDFTHVRMRDVPLINGIGGLHTKRRDAESLSIILQTLHITHPDRDHTIHYDGRYYQPEWIVFALTRLLRHEVDKIIKTTSELDTVSKAMKPKDYFNHNYNSEKGMWPEDVQGIRAVGSELPLHYGEGEVESAAIIGYGPFSYPGIAIAPFMAEGAKIDISDLLPSNIAFAEEWFSGNAEESHDDVYRRFAEQFRQGRQSGRFYTNAEQRLKETGKLHVAALEDLPSDSAQVVLESFVSCSNNIEKYGFYESIRQKARVMTWTRHSMMISVHMVGSGGWNNSGDHEGVKIPAANLSIGNIEDGYRSAGLRVVNCVPLHADSNFREDYKGMVVIFAKPDTIVRPSQRV